MLMVLIGVGPYLVERPVAEVRLYPHPERHLHGDQRASLAPERLQVLAVALTLLGQGEPVPADDEGRTPPSAGATRSPPARRSIPPCFRGRA
jgi:hypothetical protein